MGARDPGGRHPDLWVLATKSRPDRSRAQRLAWKWSLLSATIANLDPNQALCLTQDIWLTGPRHFPPWGSSSFAPCRGFTPYTLHTPPLLLYPVYPVYPRGEDIPHIPPCSGYTPYTPVLWIYPVYPLYPVYPVYPCPPRFRLSRTLWPLSILWSQEDTRRA